MNTWKLAEHTGWTLCVPFGHTRAVIRLAWLRPTWRLAVFGAAVAFELLADTEAIDRTDVAGAQDWALCQLAELAMDRAQRYTDQANLLTALVGLRSDGEVAHLAKACEPPAEYLVTMCSDCHGNHYIETTMGRMDCDTCGGSEL